MALVASRQFQRFGAFGLFVVVAWVTMRLVIAYSSERVRLSGDKTDIQYDYRQLLDRRVDIAVLEQQLSLLNNSEPVRQSTIEAPNDRAALVKLQQISRTAVEGAQGKLLSSIESATNQSPNTTGLLIRARLAEAGVSQLLSNLENGNPRIGVEDVTIASRPVKAGEAGDVEMTLTLRGRWIAIGKTAQ